MIIKRQHVKRLEAEYNDSVVAAKYDWAGLDKDLNRPLFMGPPDT